MFFKVVKAIMVALVTLFFSVAMVGKGAEWQREDTINLCDKLGYFIIDDYKYSCKFIGLARQAE